MSRRLTGLLAVLLLSPTAPAAGQQFRWPLWPLNQFFGEASSAVVVADFDLDGRPDFATAQFESDTLSISLAAPGGGFEPPIVVDVGNAYTDLGIGDFDLDGRPDLVATNQLDPWLRVFDNDGGWTWCGAQGAIVADALAVGDMNGDGRPDVVVADSWTHQAKVFLTDAGGCPSAPLSFATGAKPVDVALADFDGDGVLDVVTCNQTAETLSLLRGDGSGALLPATSVALGSVPFGLVAADLDQDGDADVAVASYAGTGAVRPWFGDGAGGLTGGPSIGLADAPASRLVAADLDADGNTDLVAALAGLVSGGGFAVIRGTGGGGFAAPVVHVQALESAGAFAVADMDEDGRLDVLLDAVDDSIPGAPDAILIVPGDGAGGFPEPEELPLPESTALAALGDLDGDGVDDLVSATSSLEGALVSVQLGDGAAGWLPPEQQPAEARSLLHLADLNGDGALDLLSAGESQSLSAALGDGMGGLGPSIVTSVIEPKDVATADVDADGDLDVFLTGEVVLFGGYIDMYAMLYRGDGTGAFPQGEFMLSVGFYDPFGSFPKPANGHVAAGDVDHDGDPDLVFSSPSQTRVWRNDGGTFPTSTTLIANKGGANGKHALLLADFDDDGHPDVVAVNGGAVSMFHGHGTGAFGSQNELIGSKGAESVAAADVDQDGLLDLIIDGGELPTVKVLRNDGAGDVELTAYHAGHRAGDLDVSDVNGDGYPDVLAELDGAGTLLINDTAHGAWADLGSGLAGIGGIPKLVGTGTLEPGSPGTLKLSQAHPGKLCVLFISKQSTPAPFKGGVLVPVPPLVSFVLLTNGAGQVNLSWAAWPPGPAGVSWYFQYAIVDPAGPVGVALSNAVRGTQPGPP